MELCFVIPALDASETVGQVIDGLHREARELAHHAQVWVIDDGSRDSTAEAAERAGAVVLRHPHNLGKGAALRRGLRCAMEHGATAAVSVDADGQHPPAEAVALALHPAPDAALVLGVRSLSRDGAPRRNQVSNGISNRFLSWFSGRALRDTQCGLRRYPVAETLALGARDPGYAFEAEVLLRAVHAGWELVEVPVHVVYPPPTSHFHVVRDPARIVLRVLSTLWDTRR